MIKSILSCFLCLLAFGACQSPSNSDHLREASEDSPMIENPDTVGREYAKRQLNDLLNGIGQLFTWDTLIKSSSTAIAMAEPILFDIFGKDQILTEKPYEVYLINGYWYISGSIPKGSKGGGFEIIMSAKDGRIIRLTHYK